MKIKAVSGIMLTLLLTGMVTLTLNIQLANSEPTTIIVPDNYEKIQWAIGNASDGDTVFVRAGTYYEHVRWVAKSISLIGENMDTTIIDGNGTGDVVRVAWPGGAVSGFTIRNGSTGIYGGGESDLNLSGNKIIENGVGISLNFAGGYISQNIIALNRDLGIYLWKTTPVEIWGNTITKNGAGLLDDGHGSNIRQNDVADNGGDGIDIWGDYSWGGCIEGNMIANNSGAGISMGYGEMSATIKNNTILQNLKGISIINFFMPFYIYTVYHNNFIENTMQVDIYSAFLNLTHVWDDGYPSGGNYWSDYSTRYPDAEELDGSGIWDTPYVIDDFNQDNYPLMEPWSLIEVPPVEDTEAYIKYVNETIQDLPDEMFTKPEEDVSDIKNDFSDLLNDTRENINEGNYKGAIEKLNTIKKEIYEEMVESAEREETILLIDDLIAYLASLL